MTCTISITTAGPIDVRDHRPSSLVHETWNSYRPACTCGWVGFWCATRELAAGAPTEHEPAKRGAFTPTDEHGGFVVGVLKGCRTELHQFVTVKVGTCRGCKKRISKGQLALRIGPEPQRAAAHDLPTWCFTCTRPPKCAHVWVPDVREPDMDRCSVCGDGPTLPMAGSR